MTHFSKAAHDLFAAWEKRELIDSLEESYQQLVDRRIDIVDFGAPDTLTPQKRAASNCKLLQQALLHRAERLLASTGTMLTESNIYALAMIARGHVETTAVLGHFCHRLESLSNGTIKFDDFEWNVADAVMGARHQTFTEARPALNIMTCLERADKYIDRHILRQKEGILQDCHAWLSEFSHPNFLSNISAFRLDRPNNRFVMRHDRILQEEDFQLPGYVDISAKLFTPLFDAFTERANSGCLD